MLSVEKQTKKKPKELEELVELPDSFREIWIWFLRLNKTRPSGFGISSITYEEMQCFFNLLQIEPEPWEIEVLELFDSIAMKISTEQQEKADKARPKN